MGIKMTYDCDLDLSYKSGELPENLHVEGDLKLLSSLVNRLPEGLYVGGDLILARSAVVKLPEDFTVEGRMYLRYSNIKDYPLIHWCGKSKRTIYLDNKDANLIHIGCFVGGRKEVLSRIRKHYKYNYFMERYINQVNECFKLGEELWGDVEGRANDNKNN